MIRTTRISHGKDGYRLDVLKVPVWAWTIDGVNNTVIAAACTLSRGWACPLCLSGKLGWPWHAGWGRDADGDLKHSLGGLLFSLGQHGGKLSLGRERIAYSAPLPFEEVCANFPECRVEWDDDGETCVRGVLV